MTVHIRPSIADDRAFVISNWSASFRSTQDIAYIPMRDYAAMYRPIYEALYDKATVLVAHGELGVLMGFIICEPDGYAIRRNGNVVNVGSYVIYVYVGELFRKRGIANALFSAANISPTSHFGYAARTRMSWMLRHKTPYAVYDPLRARYDEVGKGDQRESRNETADARE